MQTPDDTYNRRSALRRLGGATAVAATAVAGSTLGAGTAAAAVTDAQPISFIDSRVGGVLDGTTDNGPAGTNAIAKAITVLGSQGGEIFIPPGTARFASQPAPLPSNILISGAGKNATILRKAFVGVGLLRFEGTSTTARCQRGGLRDLQITGGANVGGALVTGTYADHLNFDKVWFTSHADVGVLFTEVWDTYFIGCEFEGVSGSDGTRPSVLLKSSASDSTNNIWFQQCRWESFIDGALWIATGGVSSANICAAGSNAIYGVYLDQCKMETVTAQGSFMNFSADVQDVHVTKLELGAVGLRSGATAVDLIKFVPFNFCTFTQVRALVNGNAARTVFSVFAGPLGHRVEDVNVDAYTPLTVGIVEFAGGTPTLKLRNIGYKPGQSGTIFAGARPAGVIVEDENPYSTALFGAPTRTRTPVCEVRLTANQSVAVGETLCGPGWATAVDTDAMFALTSNIATLTLPVAGRWELYYRALLSNSTTTPLGRILLNGTNSSTQALATGTAAFTTQGENAPVQVVESVVLPAGSVLRWTVWTSTAGTLRSAVLGGVRSKFVARWVGPT